MTIATPSDALPATASPVDPVTALVVAIRAISPDSSIREVRDVVARARRLGRSDLLPSWARPRASAHANPAASVPLPAPPPIPCSHPMATDEVLTAKAEESHIPLPLLREVYCRAMICADSDVHSSFSSPFVPSPEERAHARVNSFIRLCQGDFDARTDDADLLAMLPSPPSST